LEEAGQYDITIGQGSRFSLALSYEAPEGSAVDFTDSTARMQVRPKFGSGTVLFELSTSNGGITLGADGSVQLSKPASETAALTFSRAVYDLEITPPTGEPYKLIRGNVYLTRELTKVSRNQSSSRKGSFATASTRRALS
jgi:hypothetical protein